MVTLLKGRADDIGQYWTSLESQSETRKYIPTELVRGYLWGYIYDIPIDLPFNISLLSLKCDSGPGTNMGSSNVQPDTSSASSGYRATRPVLTQAEGPKRPEAVA